MKLRNKKTGGIGICDLRIIHSSDAPLSYRSLAEVNRDWEDYTLQEPLIKDEKIRKAVRAWAEANGIEQVTVEKDFSSYTFFPTDTSKVDITVWTEPSLSNLSKDKTYTIIELCGEEVE